MAHRINLSQIRNKFNQAAQKRRQAVNDYNRKVRDYNRKVKQEVDRANREIRAHNQEVKRRVDQLNREVRAHNTRVRNHRQRLRNEIAKLSNRRIPSQYVTFQRSVHTVQHTYEQLESAAESGHYNERYNDILDLSGQEAANSLGVINALLGDTEMDSVADSLGLTDSPLTSMLQGVSKDFADRWQGALFALNPRNTDAARHFCTSAREIIDGILLMKAPNDAVSDSIPDYERTQQGTPTRRARIKYILHSNGIAQDELESFVETDIKDIIQLFDIFNQGTHGTAGKFSISQLQAIRQRVEYGVMFLIRLIN